VVPEEETTKEASTQLMGCRDDPPSAVPLWYIGRLEMEETFGWVPWFALGFLIAAWMAVIIFYIRPMRLLAFVGIFYSDGPW
jgi:hypothetical protein